MERKCPVKNSDRMDRSPIRPLIGSRKKAKPIQTSGVMYVDGHTKGITRHAAPKVTNGQNTRLGSRGYVGRSSPGNMSSRVS